jgi:hypothetical protein
MSLRSTQSDGKLTQSRLRFLGLTNCRHFERPMRAALAINDESDSKRVGRALSALYYVWRSGGMCENTPRELCGAKADRVGTGAH